MKIAIHYKKGTYSDSPDSFNKRWIAYCKEKNIAFKLVDAYKSDIIDQLSDCDAFLWHFYQGSIRDFLAAKPILLSLDAAGMRTFPSINMAWHFDDKVAQKYLLEAIRAPLVPSFVFYDKEQAFQWSETAELPLVFKLKGGGGSQNVKLLVTKKAVRNHIKKAFGKGFSQYSGWGIFKDRFQKYQQGKDSLAGVLKGFIRLLLPTPYARFRSRDKGYIYLQKFIPGNDSDTRIIVIGNRAFGIIRKVRKNDFRASGGGTISYDKENVDMRTVQMAFEVSKKLHLECVAYDFVFDQNNDPLIVEISYGFAIEAYDPCPGYWDNELDWHEGRFNPQAWMIDDLSDKIRLD